MGFAQSLEMQILKRNVRETIKAVTAKTIADVRGLRSVAAELASATGGVVSEGQSIVITSLNAAVAEVTARKSAVTAHDRVVQAETSAKDAAARLTRAQIQRRSAMADLRTARQRTPPPPDDELSRLQGLYDSLSREAGEWQAASSAAERNLQAARAAEPQACNAYITANEAHRRIETTAAVPDLPFCSVTSPAATLASGTRGGNLSMEQRVDGMVREHSDLLRQLQNVRYPEDADKIAMPAGLVFVGSGANSDERLYMIKDMTLGHAPVAPVVLFDGQSLSDPKTVIKVPEIQAIQRTFRDVTEAMDAQAREEAARMQPVAIVKSLGLFLIALMIPSVALIYKVTSGRDLRSYFSRRHQAMRGCPEALEEETIRRMVDEGDRDSPSF